MSKIEQIAKLIVGLTHSELLEVAGELVGMQTGAEEDGWAWHPKEVYGEFGMAEMLHSWAESKTT